MSVLPDLTTLEAQLRQPQQGIPPLERWHPPFSGVIDIRIDREGQWFHEGGRIEREPLRRLFASILRREEDGHYYLVTPVEKWRIAVDHYPLRVIDLDWFADEQERPCALLSLDDGTSLTLDDAHPLSIGDLSSEEPEPHVSVRHGLSALLVRSVFYRLVEQAEVDDQQRCWLSSAGQRFLLGQG